MKIKSIVSMLLLLVLITNIKATENYIEMEFKDAKLEDLINVISKIEDKNILFDGNINNEKINFVTNHKIKEKDLMDVFISILATKNLSLIENEHYYKIINTRNINQEFIPISLNEISKDNPLIRTEMIKINHSNPEILVQKIRGFLNPNTKIVPIKEKNLIIVTDIAKNIKHIKQLLFVLDKDSTKEYFIYKLSHQKADEVFNILKNTSLKMDDKINENIGEFILDKNTNSIIIVGSKEIIKKYKNLIIKLDIKENKTEEKIEIVFLKNSVAQDMSKILNEIIGKTKKTDEEKKEQETIVSIDEEMNALILVGIKSNIDKLKDLVSKLDIPRQQVYVKATIIELKKDLVDKFGLKYGFEAGTLTNNSLFTLGTTLTGQSVSTSLLPINIPKDLSRGMAVGVSLDLLKRNNVLEVLSEPSILCINNKESEVNVAETISVLKSTQSPDIGGTIRSYDRTDVGILLKIKPVLSTDNKVSLDVEAKLEGIVSMGQEIGTPTTTKREVKTTAIVNDGEPVIIGGLIKTEANVVESKVPILGDIPLLGYLFRSKEEILNKTNLVIILTPYIIKQSSDLTELREKLSELDQIQKTYNDKMIKYIEENLIEKEKIELENKEDTSSKITEHQEDFDDIWGETY